METSAPLAPGWAKSGCRFAESPLKRPSTVKSAKTASRPKVQTFWNAAEKRMPRKFSRPMATVMSRPTRSRSRKTG